MGRRSIVRALAHTALVIALGGCITTRYYPVCVLPPPSETPEAAWDTARPLLGRTVKMTMGGKAFTLDSAGAAARGYGWEHRQLRRIWPSLACVGHATDLAGDILLRQCQIEVQRYFDDAKPVWPGPLGQTDSVCARPASRLER